jgi:hypothetical protein
MITIVKAPALNRVLLDANNTEITIQSTNGVGYYFRAIINVDDVFFDEQGWSRNTAFVAVKDLVKLYNAYFESVFSSFTENALVEQLHLKKKISITINEYYLETNTIVDTIALPDFYFMYNAKPIYFDDTTKIQILGIEPAVLQIPKNGKMRVPFYVKAVDEAVTVEVKDNFGTVINYQIAPSFIGKKIFQYQFDLSGVTLASNTIYFETIITCGTATTIMRYRLMNLPDFPVKEIYFKNNFGYYIPAYLDGEFEEINGLKINDYQEADGSHVVFEIEEESTYTINTGHLLQDERAIVTQITTSLDILLKVNNVWQRIQTATKKELRYRDKKHNYSQDLVFTFKKNGKVNNYYDSDLGGDWDERDFSPTDWLT